VPGKVLEPGRRDARQRLFDLESLPAHTTLERLGARGFHTLVLLLDDKEALGIIALGDKIVPGPLGAVDRQLLEAFSVVMSLSVKNSLAYQLVERSRNELQRLDEMKREFMSHVSHEFRTPLTVLKNTIELTTMESDLAEMQRSALARLEYLVGSILLFNESDAGAVMLERAPVALRAWVEEEVRPLLASRGDFELHSALPTASISSIRRRSARLNRSSTTP
jgi:signal transduction histidine kinase